MSNTEKDLTKRKWINTPAGKSFLMGFVMSIGCKLSSPITDYYEPITSQQFRNNPNSLTELRLWITVFLPFLIIFLILFSVDLILKRSGNTGFDFFTKRGPYKASSFLFGFFAFAFISVVITVLFKYI
ncbi:MAG: hypothetical protein GY943_10905 [Chloroflexi bacterium]|nr:hypothetical protein [Chloroflexota bacterium]